MRGAAWKKVRTAMFRMRWPESVRRRCRQCGAGAGQPCRQYRPNQFGNIWNDALEYAHASRRRDEIGKPLYMAGPKLLAAYFRLREQGRWVP